jgi:DNA repair exonuclease SbcCD nuclease subunit
MKYAIAADLHFHAWSAFAETTPEGMNSRLAGLIAELHRMADEAAEFGAQTLVLAGDVFHVRGSVSPIVLNSLRDALQAIDERLPHMTVLILAGNHDLEGKNSNRLGSAVTALEMDSVRVYNHPAHRGSMLLIPWYESIEELKAVSREYANSITDPSETDLILHAPIDGVIEGLPDHGLTPDWLAEQGFRRVLSGHYHNHKDFGNGVYSIGALAHHTWSDVGSKAGFLLVDDDSVQWRKSHLPEFLDLDNLTEVDPAMLPFVVEGNFVRARIESELVAKVDSLRSELLGMGAKGALIQPVPKAPTREGAVAATTKAGASLEVSMGEFINSMPAIELIRAEVVKEAMSVLSVADSTGV